MAGWTGDGGVGDLSWIWYSMSEQELQGGKDVEASLRVEWAKARARAMCWREGLLLFEKEMRRFLDFCWWKSQWRKSQWRKSQWRKSRKQGRTEVGAQVAEGMSAYAEQRAGHPTGVKSEQEHKALQASNIDDDDSWPELVVEIPDDEDDNYQDMEDDENEGT